MNRLFKETPGDKKIRVATSVTVVLLALSAGILSYDALRALAVEAGIPPLLAILFPITVDGLILSGSLLMLFFANKGKRSAYGFFLTALGVIMSIAGNVAVSIDTLVSQLVHATSPVVLFLSLEALTILLRWRSKMTQETEELERVAAEEKKRAEEERTKEEAAEKKREQEALERLDAEEERRNTEQREAEAKIKLLVPSASIPTEAPHKAYEGLPALTNRSWGQEGLDAPAEPHRAVPDPLDTSVPFAPSASSQAVTAQRRGSYEPDPIPAAPKEENADTRAPKPHATAPTPEAKPKPKAQPKPVTKDDSSSGKTLREQIGDMLDENPEVSVDHIADKVDGERKYVRKLAREEMGKREDAA